MKKVNLFIAFLIICQSANVFGATITWLGGNGDWDVSSFWDLGRVPHWDDEVIINSGNVVVSSYGEADHILLRGGELRINGTLSINVDQVNSDGNIRGIVIATNSTLINEGILVLVEGIIPSGIAHFINNSGSMTNSTIGTVIMVGNSFTGIHSFTNSMIVNDGSIDMFTINSGFYLLGQFVNNGYIHVNSTSTALTVRNIFNNNTSGEIEANNKISINSGGQLSCQGSINIESNSDTYNFAGNSAIINDGILNIFSGGSVYIYGDFGYGIWAYDNSETRVYGNLEIDLPNIYDYAVNISGLFVNHQSGKITTKSHYGVVTLTGGDTRNYGTWQMLERNGGGYQVLVNYGVFSNRPKGKLYVDGRINSFSGSTFNNQGHMFVTSEVQQTLINGALINNGAINDVYGKLPSITNQSYISRPITGTISTNVPIPNALDRGNNPGATVLGWYTNNNYSISAGTYNSVTNTFTPNANAVGLSTLIVKIRINTGGAIKQHKVLFENAIQPLTGSNNEHLSIESSYTEDWNIFPNPANEVIHITTEGTSNLSITLYDLSGKIISTKNCIGDENCFMEVSDDLSNGIYYITKTSEKGIISKKQLQIIR